MITRKVYEFEHVKNRLHSIPTTGTKKCTTSFLHKSKPPQKDIDAERILAEVEAMFEEEKKRLKEFLAEDEAILKEYVVCDISVCRKLNSKILKTRKTNSRTK